jgi:hypothetical protein
VEEALTPGLRLMTPENTPEPEILVRRSKGNQSAEHLSTTGEDASERSSGKDRAQDPPARGVLEPASASIGQDDREPTNRESETRIRADEELKGSTSGSSCPKLVTTSSGRVVEAGSLMATPVEQVTVAW